MASWLQAQLKAAENLLEAVDRTVSSATGGPQAAAAHAGDEDTGRHETSSGSANNQYGWKQAQESVSQAFNQQQSSLEAAQKGASALLRGGPGKGGVPFQSSPQRPGSASASPQHPAQQQQQQLWQPFPSTSATGSTPPAPLYSSQAPGGSGASLAGLQGTPPSSANGAHAAHSNGLISSSLQQPSPPAPVGAPVPQAAAGPKSGTTVAPLAAQTELPAYSKQPHGPAPSSSLSSAVPPGPLQAANSQPSAATPLAAVAAAQEHNTNDFFVQSLEPHQVAQLQEGNGSDLLEVAQRTGSSMGASDAGAAAAAHPPEPIATASSAEETGHAAPPAIPPSTGAETPGAAAAAGTVTAAGSTDPESTGRFAAGGQAATVPASAAAAASAAEQPQQQADAEQPVATSAAAPADVSSTDGSSVGAVANEAAATVGHPSAAAAGTATSSFSESPSPAGGGVAKEAQLTRLVETLRKRLEVVRGENQQLEDMLHAAEQRSSSEQARIAQLTSELASLQREQDGIVVSAAANAAAQDAHIGRLQAELEGSSRQVVALQAELQSVREQHAEALNSKDSMEGGALEALRAENAIYEGQLEAEQRAHAATKAAAASRERNLEEQLGSSSEALAAMQRQLDEAASRSRELEQQQVLAAAEAARLQEQVRQLSEQQSSMQQPDPNLQLQLEAETEALHRRLAEAEAQALSAVQAQRAAEARVAELQQEVAHLHSSYQASAATRGPPQLEQQLHELQELLYQKQQQLERLSGEKQAQQLMLERQITSLKSELGKAHAAAASAVTEVRMRGAHHDIIPMDALGEPYQRLARHNKLGGVVQATAQFLDTTAASASQLLRQQPLARLIVFVYVILIHLYVYFLLARMQKQALLLIAQQEKGSGVGPEHMMLSAMAPPFAPPPLPPPAGGNH